MEYIHFNKFWCFCFKISAIEVLLCLIWNIHIYFLQRTDFCLGNDCYHTRLLFISNGHIMALLKLTHLTSIFIFDVYSYSAILDNGDIFWTRPILFLPSWNVLSSGEQSH